MKNYKSKKNWIYAVGRRRTAVARARLFRGKGENVVNDKPFDVYFPGSINKAAFNLPFELTGTTEKYFVTIKVVGGGKNGQLEASVHAIAKALNLKDTDKFRIPLKKAGLLTRDSRIRERRKVGMGGKSRRKKQSPRR